jgi:methanogenic corrinoid protein MtbC1
MKTELKRLYEQLETEKKRKTNICITYGAKEKKENIRDIKANIRAEKKRINSLN